MSTIIAVMFIVNIIRPCLSSVTIRPNKTKVTFGVDCPEFGGIENGKITKIVSSNIQALHIECEQGFDLIGRPKVLCNDGQWEQIPRPQCAKRCPPPPFVRNAEVRIEGRKDDQERYRKGSQALYSCGEGFILTPPSSKSHVCKDGIWTGTQGTCVAYGCQLPPDIESGYYVLENMPNIQPDNSASGIKAVVNQRAHYNCNLGYVLTGTTGSATLQCIESGDWSPRIPPTCSKILPDDDGDASTSCGPPALGPHMSATTLSGLRTGSNHALPNTELELRCHEGYRDVRDSCPPTAPPNVLRCLDGGWEGAVPKCVEVDGCVSPTNIHNGALFGLASDGRYQINAQVAYTCLPGYLLYGNPVLSCSTSGCWEPLLLPECRPEVFVTSGYISSSTLLISLVTALGVMLILLGVCLVVVCRRKRRPWQGLHHSSLHRVSSQRGRGGSCPASPSPLSAGGGSSTTAAVLHDPDRVALIACADGVLLGESMLPSYEEAVRERSGVNSGGGALLAYRPHRPHWTTLGTARRPRAPGDGMHVTRQSSSSTSHSASLRSGSAGDSMGSTDTMAPSDVSTNVTLDTVSSHTCSSGSQTASCRAICGSLASFDTSSVLNTEGVPLLEESELEDGVMISAPGLVLDQSISDSSSYKYRRASPDLA